MFGQLLLYSFERAGKALEESGDDACVEPPVSIPNTAVKHARAESTWLETAWEVRSLPVKALAYAGAFFLALRGILLWRRGQGPLLRDHFADLTSRQRRRK